MGAGYWEARPPSGVEQLLVEAEAAGVDSFWTSEAYGSDGLMPLAWWGSRTSTIKLGTSICQLSARTPTALATAAMTLDHLSNGRVIVGLGASGPQVVEGWSGQPYPQPLESTREYVEIMRAVIAREDPVHPLRPEIPIYVAAEGPKNVALAAEIADGWLPMWFSPKLDQFYREALSEGLTRPGARHDASTFEVANLVWLVEHDDVEVAASFLKPMIALYVGGMGAKDVNLHNDVFVRMGWSEVCDEIQDLYLAGKKQQAADAVPTTMVEDVALVGPVDKIVEEITHRWRPTCMTTMILGGWPQTSSRDRILDACHA